MRQLINFLTSKKTLYSLTLTVSFATVIVSCLFLYKKNGHSFPLNSPCRSNLIVEAKYDHLRAKMIDSLSFSFLDKNKILVSLSGTAYLYDDLGKLVDRKIVLRNIYYDSVNDGSQNDTWTITSRQINIDTVDDLDEKLSSLLLLNSFFVNNHTDTLILRPFDDNTMLIESNQSPITLCVFSDRN